MSAAYVIEFRSGSFFQNLDAENGGPKATAQRFESEDAAWEFMGAHQWMLFAGGMPVPA